MEAECKLCLPVMNSDGDVIGLIVEQTVSILEIVDYHK